MATHYSQEFLESLSAALNVQVIELVQIEKNLAGERRNDDPSRFLLEHFAETDKVAVPPAHFALSFLERGYVRATDNLVVGVLFLAVVGSRVRHLSLVLEVRGD